MTHLLDSAAEDDPSVLLETCESEVQDRAADVVEEDVEVSNMLFELSLKILVLVIEGLEAAEVVLQPATLFLRSRDGDDLAAQEDAADETITSGRGGMSEALLDTEDQRVDRGSRAANKEKEAGRNSRDLNGNGPSRSRCSRDDNGLSLLGASDVGHSLRGEKKGKSA